MKRTRISRMTRILNTDNKWMNTDFEHRDMELRGYAEITKHRDMEVRRYTEMKREKEERREKEVALRALIKAKPLCFSRLLHTFKPCVSVFKPAFNLRKSALICVSKWRNPCHPCHPCPFLFMKRIKAKPLCISRLLIKIKPRVSVFSVIFNFQFYGCPR